MLTVNIDPVLFSLGPIEIRYYGLVYILGILLVYFYLKKKGEMSPEKIEKLLFYLVIGMFVGARIFGLLSNNVNIFSNPLELFRVWNGGMSFFGGFFGALIGAWFVLREKMFEVGDQVVVPISFVLIFGRLANFINQELVGAVTDVSWCFNFVTSLGCRHPYQLYSAAGQLVLFLGVYLMSKLNYWILAQQIGSMV